MPYKSSEKVDLTNSAVTAGTFHAGSLPGGQRPRGIDLQLEMLDVCCKSVAVVSTSRACRDAQRKDEFTDLTAELLVCTEADGHHEGLLVLALSA